jgi:hypothetical protein
MMEKHGPELGVDFSPRVVDFLECLGGGSMKSRVWFVAVGCLSVVCFLILSGCGGIGGEKLVVIRGRVVENGQPIKAGGPYGGAPRVEVTFYPVDASGNLDSAKQSWSATVQADGTFVVDGVGKGIPAGRYKVGLRGEPPSGQYDPRAPKAAGGDIFEGKFSLQKTPFTFEFTSNQEITLEIGQAGASEGSGAASQE